MFWQKRATTVDCPNDQGRRKRPTFLGFIPWLLHRYSSKNPNNRFPFSTLITFNQQLDVGDSPLVVEPILLTPSSRTFNNFHWLLFLGQQHHQNQPPTLLDESHVENSTSMSCCVLCKVITYVQCIFLKHIFISYHFTYSVAIQSKNNNQNNHDS